MELELKQQNTGCRPTLHQMPYRNRDAITTVTVLRTVLPNGNENCVKLELEASQVFFLN